METRKYCAYNKTRETFLSYSFTVIDAALEPLRVLKLLIEGLPRGATTGIWLTHFKDVPVAQALSPFDLVYLDKDYRVVHGVELTTDGAFTPFKGEPASALILPPRSLSGSKTSYGDQLLIRFAEEAQGQTERTPLPDHSPIQPRPSAEPGTGAHFASSVFPAPAAEMLSKARLERFLGNRAPQSGSPEPRVQSSRSLIELTPRSPAQPVATQGPANVRHRAEPPAASTVPGPLTAPVAAPAGPSAEASATPSPAAIASAPGPLAASAALPEASVYPLQSSAAAAQAKPPEQVPVSSAAESPRPADRRQPLDSPKLVYPIERPVAPEHPALSRALPRFESREEPIVAPSAPAEPTAIQATAAGSALAAAVPLAPEEILSPAIFDVPGTELPPVPTLEPPAPAIMRPRPPVPASEPEPFKLRILRWLFPELKIEDRKRSAHDRRRAHRIPVPDLVAYYWTGGAPRPRKIGNMSVTGFYLQTEERWMPGTVIRMTLQLVGSSGEGRHDSVTVHSRIVRWGPDGEAFEFVLAGFDRLSKQP